MSAQLHAAELPRLDAFDEEFGQDPVAILRAQRRKTRTRIWMLVAVAVGAAAVGALALTWSTADVRLRREPQSAPMQMQSANREAPSDEVDRLRRELEALKTEIRELAQARQEAADTIAVLKAAAQEAPSPSVSFRWYSNPAALTLGIEGQSQPSRVALPPRRTAAARPAPRRVQRRDTRGRVSLEPPQQ